MANKKISQLDAGTLLTGSERIPMAQLAKTAYCTPATLSTYTLAAMAQSGSYVTTSEFNDALSHKADLEDGHLRFSQMPTTHFRTLAEFPPSGEKNIIYLALDTGILYYRTEDGSYEAIGSSGGSGVVFAGAADELPNPGDTTVLYFLTSSKDLLFWDGGSYKPVSFGLDNVDNTSDANKPVSTAQQTALNAKLDTSAFSNTNVSNKLISTLNTPPGYANTPISTADSIGTAFGKTQSQASYLFSNVSALSSTINTKESIASDRFQDLGDMKFNSKAIYGTFDTPVADSVITLNPGDIIPGVTALIVHDGSGEPAYPSEFKKLKGSQSYSPGEINYIFCLAMQTDRILYTITQEL